MRAIEFVEKNNAYFHATPQKDNYINKYTSYSLHSSGVALFDSQSADRIMRDILGYHLEKMLTIYVTAKKYTQVQIDLLKQNPEELLPDLETFFSFKDRKPEDCGYDIQIIYVPQGISIIPLINSAPELKHVSLALQLHQKHKVRVFETQKEKCYTIYTTDISTQFYAMVQAAALTLMPKLFKDKEKVMPIVEQYLSGNEDKFMEEVVKYYNSNNILQRAQFEKLKKILTQKTNSKLSHLKSTLRNHESALEDLLSSYRHTLEALEDTRKQIFAYETSPQKDVSEVVDYLIKSKTVIVDQTSFSSSTSLYLKFITPIEYYDPEVARTMLEKKEMNATLKSLLKETFLDGNYKLLTAALVEFNLTTNRFANYSSSPDPNYYPHPHIAGFNCFGNNKPLITKALAKEDYITAIEQAAATCKNLNFYDSTVFDKMISNFRDSYYAKLKCFENTATHQIISYNDYKTMTEGKAV